MDVLCLLAVQKISLHLGNKGKAHQGPRVRVRMVTTPRLLAAVVFTSPGGGGWPSEVKDMTVPKCVEVRTEPRTFFMFGGAMFSTVFVKTRKDGVCVRVRVCVCLHCMPTVADT
jgi:hypothetical protein